ncbi:MAG TPA: NgoFVII family restriction endonuclease [Pyrinomonadaceae bacterium]|nr:NgoFVII family restriction endonuclease [Pyrinomonadaceae bacterium]
MELLLSQIAPAKLSSRNTISIWQDNLKTADELTIASGYISSDALIELAKIVEINRKPQIDLLIGMHWFDGFTHQQYEAAASLNRMLSERKLGGVYLSNKVRFHGKIYAFSTNEICTSAIIGSSNLSSFIGSSERLYETDCYFTEGSETKSILATLDQLFDKLATPLNEMPTPTVFKEYNDLLEDHYWVERVNNERFADVQSTKTGREFSILIKPEPKSHLNCFFGKGRESKRGFVLPRPWYEVEIMAGSTMTSQPGYPRGKEFTVITDDQWSFKCLTQGDYFKNLRSTEDLKIMGKWIKGRMEARGALKIGEPVTQATFDHYGNQHLILSETTDPDIWLLDFSPDKE